MEPNRKHPPSRTSVPLTAVFLPAFIRRSPVTVILDRSSESSCVSPVIIHELDLPCSFGTLGIPLAVANVHTPADDGGYHSCLSLPLSYNITSDIESGNDWLAHCKPVLASDQSHTVLKPSQSAIDILPPPHSWHPTDRSLL